MPRAQTAADLYCKNCSACIAREGYITCMRCKEQVPIASAAKRGPWSCPKCPEHGKRPKTLAVDGAIQCKFCEHKVSILGVEETNMPEEKVTLTSLYRDSISLALTRLALRDQRGLTSFSVDWIKKERTELENALATLDMGFDPERFDEILPGYRSGIPGELPAHGRFDYFLPTKRHQGLKYVGFYLFPKTKAFSIVAREPINGRTIFLLADVALENVSYGESVYRAMMVPKIIVAGNLLGLPIRADVSEYFAVITGVKGVNADQYTADDKAIYYYIELESEGSHYE